MRRKALKVLVATNRGDVLQSLPLLDSQVVLKEALSTGGAYKSLEGCHLAIIDFGWIRESGGISREGLEEAIKRSKIPFANPDEFVEDPRKWKELALASLGMIRALEPRAIAFTSATGGVGKTSLSLALSRYVSEGFNIPTLVLELSFGKGALRALTEPEAPHFWEVLSQGAEIASWKGVKVLPMDYETACLAEEESVLSFFRGLKKKYMLLVVDAHLYHPFFPPIRGELGRVFYVSSPRPDSLLNALHLSKDNLILNMMRRRDKIGLLGVKRILDIPFVGDPLGGKVGGLLMKVVYPGYR